jgi:hypothetical protein
MNMPSIDTESDGPPITGVASTPSSSQATPSWLASQATTPSRARISFQA